MFKKTQRLNRGEFEKCFKSGQRKHFSHLTIITAPAGGLKVAVVVGKKVAKSAVKRNLLKRRVVARLRECTAAESYTGVLIVVLKPTYATLPRKAADDFLTQSIAGVLKSA